MTLLVRDEADIIASNIEFHLSKGVDFIIAMDNLSVDGTTDILHRYERQGVLHYINQVDDNYSQCRWVTHMARLACTEYSADWVINNDADEFWWPEKGNLKEALGAISPLCDAVNVGRVNFPPRLMTERDFFADVMDVRECHSLNALGQPLPAKICHRAFPDIEVGQGNHMVSRQGHVLSSEAVPITIFHFPMRSYSQFANKIIKGGAAYERNTELPLEIGATWRHLYDTWQRGELEAVYQASVLNDETVEHGLREGLIIRDERLKMTLSRLNSLRCRHD